MTHGSPEEPCVFSFPVVPSVVRGNVAQQLLVVRSAVTRRADRPRLIVATGHLGIRLAAGNGRQARTPRPGHTHHALARCGGGIVVGHAPSPRSMGCVSFSARGVPSAIPRTEAILVATVRGSL